MERTRTTWIKFLSGPLAALPIRAFAAAPTSFKGFIGLFLDLIETAIPIIGSLVLLVFFWGLAMFIGKTGSDKGREEGRTLMFWGVIGLFVIVTFWGIVLFMKEQFGFSGGLVIPLLPTS